MKRLERFQTILLVAGVGFFVLSFIGMGVAPWTTLKGLTSPEGVTARTAQEERGREIFMHEGCWHCHTQFVRPIAGESRRYGPVSFAAEYLNEVPQLFGTRRVGPDLAREGGKRSDDWHNAHFYNPRLTTPWSIMPGYAWLFTERDGRVEPTEDGKALVAYMQSIGRSVRPAMEEHETAFRAQFMVGTGPAPTPDSIERGQHLFARECAGCHGARGDGQSGASDFLQPPAADLTAVHPTAAYVYRVLNLGVPGSSMPIFREYHGDDLWAIAHYVAQLTPTAEAATTAPTEAAQAQYAALCAVCHGASGHGDGPAGLALRPAPPDFHGLRPTTARVMAVLQSGVPGTGMPPFPQLSDEERRGLAALIRSWIAGANTATAP